MAAFAFSLGLFVYWTIIGYALCVLLHTRRDRLRQLLLAPAIGLSVHVCVTFMLSWAGFPVIRFGVALGLLLALAAAGVLAWLRPKAPLKYYWPFAGVFLLALLVTGRPMLEFGFSWLSYCNDDMTTYCLSGLQLLHHGIGEVPSKEELLSGSDYSLFTWYLHGCAGVRPGSDLILAWASSVTGLSVPQVYMPVILAFHLALLSAAAGLVCTTSRQKRNALITAILLGLSALTSLGALYQLIAQVSGIAIMTCCVGLLFRSFCRVGFVSQFRYGLLVGVVTAGLFIVYPEVLPFLGVGFFLFLFVSLVRRKWDCWRLAVILPVGACVVAVVMQKTVLDPLDFLLEQARVGAGTDGYAATLFPYYLVPSGVANLWGLQSLFGMPGEPWMSTSILLGGLLLLATGAAAAWMTWRRQPVAVLALCMLAVGLHLYLHRAGFGLFKLAMFIQPFLLGTLVIAWAALAKRRWVRLAPLLVLGLVNLWTQSYYLTASRGDGAAVTEVPNPSGTRVNEQFAAALRSRPARRVIIPSTNYVLAKFQAYFARGVPTTFIGLDIRPQLQRFVEVPRRLSLRDRPQLDVEFIERDRPVAEFRLHDPDDSSAVERFPVQLAALENGPDADETTLILHGPGLSILNRQQTGKTPDRLFTACSLREVRNYITPVESDLCKPYFGCVEAEKVGIWQQEADPMVPGGRMAGLGRHQLFRVFGASPRVRVVLDFTCTYRHIRGGALPHGIVIGAERQPFDVAGGGAARVVSPPLAPQWIGGAAYLALDLNETGTSFAEKKTGLMALCGTDLSRDRRKLTGFVRDISVISEDDYRAFEPPSEIASFPAGLLHPHLEFSGVCEDGWASDHSYYHLTQPADAGSFLIKGIIPRGKKFEGFTPEIVVTVDGDEVLRETLQQGRFELRAPVVPGKGRRRVEIRFSDSRPLRGPDGRVVSARIFQLGFDRGEGEPPNSSR